MRQPRDYDAELKALQAKAKGLKARKTTQLGELVCATGADQLDLDMLAGVLLAAVETTDAKTREGWSRRGAAFFQRRARKPAGQAVEHAAPAPADGGGHAPG